MLTGVVAEGMIELLAQYFQLKLGFNTQDQVGLTFDGYVALLGGQATFHEPSQKP